MDIDTNGLLLHGSRIAAGRRHTGAVTLGALSTPIHLETLPNGLTMLLREVHVAPVAEVEVWARVGSADEGPGEAGLAHFHEHMLFKGTESRSVGEIAGAVEGVGGRINAFTSFDVTCYYATIPVSEVGVGIDVLADAVQHSIFDPEEVSREVEVVLEEIRRSLDDPHHVLSDAVFEAAYRVHPYRAPILGPPDNVASFDREKVERFYRRWYGPDNLVVVATGDFETEAMAERIRRAFEAATPTGVERHRPAEPDPDGLRSVLLRRPFERACLDLSWRTVELSHPDTAALDLLAFVLGEGESSRLVQRVKEEQGLADRIDASSYTPLDPGLFGSGIDADPAKAERAVEAVAGEVERLRHERIPEDELEKARSNFLATRHWEQESVTGIARKLANSFIMAGDAHFEDTYLERIRQATPDDLLAVAQRWLEPERLTIGAVVPESADADLDAAALESAVERGVAATRRSFRAPRQGQRQDDVFSYELENGIAVHVIPRREIPVVSLRAAMLGGLLAETEETAGLSGFLASMWLRGAGPHGAGAFAHRVESLAADIDGFSGRSSSGLTLDATREQWLPTLDLFAEVVLRPSFADEEIERERAETLAAIARRDDRPGARAFDLFTRTHYQSHPYRLPLGGTAETVTRFDGAVLREHQRRLMQPKGLCIAVVGDVEPEDVAAQVSHRLGALSAEGPGLALPDPEPEVHEVRSAVEHKDRAQAHLVIGFRGLTVHDPDRDALEVVSQLLAGQGGRLFLELRDRRSLAYSVSAVNVEALAPGFFSVYIATAPEKYEEARAGILDELRRLVDDPPEEAELDRARRYLAGNFAIDQQRASNRALHTALDALYGLGPAADRDYAERVSAVSREDVLRVARRVFDLEAYTLAAIRPAED